MDGSPTGRRITFLQQCGANGRLEQTPADMRNLEGQKTETTYRGHDHSGIEVGDRAAAERQRQRPTQDRGAWTSRGRAARG